MTGEPGRTPAAGRWWRLTQTDRSISGMRARVLGPLVLVIACGCDGGAPAAAAHWTPEDSARVEAILGSRAAAHEFMGAVAFVRDGRTVHAQGVGMADVAAGRAFTPETPADGGSLAKTLTAAAAWSLVHEGRIAIDTPATAYLRDYPHAGTTVRQLIAHTNGLTPYYEQFDPYLGAREVRTTAGLLGVVRREMPRPRFTPGTRFEYSNLGFDAAALVVERVTGQSIAEVYRERFFVPLGMDSAFARPARFADFPGPRTLGHRWADTAWVVVDVFDNEGFIGGSNVYFSVLDLARWGGANASGTALPPAVVQLGQARPVIDGRSSPITGLSWYCDGSGARCYYTGAINAFNGLVYWDRERSAAVAMISNSHLAPWTLATLQRDLVAALEGRDPDRAARPAFVTVDAKRRGAVAGRYAMPGGDTILVTDSPGGLRLRAGDGLEFDVFHVAPDEFYVPGPDYFLGFTGEVGARRMHVRSVFADFVAPRVPDLHPSR
ncbi:MAG: beta-lactamase family protein [Gemmatimonadetes bacterium]|nr:beta-lactamase family protein [Gemmatimonadota bacterium]